MIRLMVVLILMTTLAAGASAQTGKHVAIGAAITFRDYIEDDFEATNPGVSPIWRLSLHPENHRDGWKLEPTATAGWSRTKTNQVIGGEETRLGRLKAISVLAGGGPSYRHGPMKVGLTLMGGLSFNDFDVDDAARNRYLTIGQTLSSVEVKDEFVGRASVGAWRDLGEWIGLHASASYLFHRPKAKITVDDVTTESEWKTDRITLLAGLAVGLF